MHLQDLGSGSYTEFDNDGAELVDLYTESPELMDMRCGLIHSHHTMGAFFSSTDQEELHEKAKNGMYFSLIVNNHMKPCAKLCWTGETEVEVKSESTKHIGGWRLGGIWNRAASTYVENTTTKEKALVYYEIEFDIEFADSISHISDRYAELDEKSLAVQARKLQNQYGVHGSSQAYQAYTENGFPGGGSGKAGFQIPQKSIPGQQSRLFEGDGQKGPEDSQEDEAYEAWLKAQKGITELTVWEGLKDHGYEQKAYSAFLYGGPTTEPFNSVMAEVMTSVKEEVEKERSSIVPGSAMFGQLYEDACLERAAELVSEGDAVIANLAGQFYIDDGNYHEFLIDLMAELEKTRGIFNNALREVIKVTVLEDEDDDEIIAEIEAQG